MTDDGQGPALSHGTCVASKAVGRRYGVSKSSNLVILKVTPAIEDIIWAFFTAHKNILDRNRQGKAVITFAYAAYTPSQGNYEISRIKQLMQNLFDIDATIVVPSGNYAGISAQINTVPAIWSSWQFPLIVVGAVQRDGYPAAISQNGPQVTAHAPGDLILCAGPGGALSMVHGTSPATGMVRLRPTHWNTQKQNMLMNQQLAGSRPCCLLSRLAHSPIPR